MDAVTERKNLQNQPTKVRLFDHEGTRMIEIGEHMPPTPLLGCVIAAMVPSVADPERVDVIWLAYGDQRRDGSLDTAGTALAVFLRDNADFHATVDAMLTGPIPQPDRGGTDGLQDSRSLAETAPAAPADVRPDGGTTGRPRRRRITRGRREDGASGSIP